MGLDSVEIVMKVEDAFDLAIEDTEAEKITTPGQLIELVMGKVGRTSHSACLTQRAFHRLRASLMNRFAMKRIQIRPETPLVELFPRPVRKLRLRQIFDDLAVSKSLELVRPRWLDGAMFAGILGGGTATALFAAWHPVSSSHFVLNLLTASPVLAGIIFAFLFGWSCLRLTQGLRYEFKPSVTTVAGLSRWVVANAPNLVQAPPGQWSREQVAEKIREIVIDQLGCEKNYREDAHFVEDLGLG
jgi:acyl carrier protein